MSLLYILLIFYTGACWSSFLLATFTRRRNGISILYPRSHCDTCLTTLPYFCLFPLFSYIISRGHCLYCSCKIPITVLIAEFLGGLLFLNYSDLLTSNLLLTISLLVLSFLAIEDLAIQEVHSLVLLFPALLVTRFDFSFSKLFFLIILTLLLLNNLDGKFIFKKMGQADLEIILFIVILYDVSTGCQIIFFSSLLALLSISFQKAKSIPFIPYFWFSTILLTLST